MLPIATALIGLLASMLLTAVFGQQTKSCFTSEFDQGKYVYLNDIVAFDLSQMSTGNNLEFKLAPNSSAAAQVQNTFGDSMN